MTAALTSGEGRPEPSGASLGRRSTSGHQGCCRRDQPKRPGPIPDHSWRVEAEPAAPGQHSRWRSGKCRWLCQLPHPAAGL